VFGFLKVKELVIAIPDIAEVVFPRHEQLFFLSAKSSAIKEDMAKRTHGDLKSDYGQLL
jgi:hypothetical protein